PSPNSSYPSFSNPHPPSSHHPPPRPHTQNHNPAVDSILHSKPVAFNNLSSSHLRLTYLQPFRLISPLNASGREGGGAAVVLGSSPPLMQTKMRINNK